MRTKESIEITNMIYECKLTLVIWFKKNSDEIVHLSRHDRNNQIIEGRNGKMKTINHHLITIIRLSMIP